MTIVSLVLVIVAILLLVPVAILFVEVLSALLVKQRSWSLPIERPPGLRVAVLVPAHDEEDGIGTTVSEIAKQLDAADRLIVVADNCSDATAERARAAGAESILRHDLDHIGKGYALDFGVRHLNSDPPDIVIIVDADCRLGRGAIVALATCSHRSHRPAQAFYEMIIPLDADAKRRVAGFAWIVKNHVRTAGLSGLRFPCQLMGTGMAFPWAAIRNVNLATGNIVEDVKMGLDLAEAGFPPIFCPSAQLKSDFPMSERGFTVQRLRWEIGSLRTFFKLAPVKLLRGTVAFNVPLVAMAVDLMVPPTMMLLTILILGLGVSFVFAIAGGSSFPSAIFGVSLIGLVGTLAMAWLGYGRDVLPPRYLLTLPGVFAWKFGLYLAMWRGRGMGWIRTDRK